MSEIQMMWAYVQAFSHQTAGKVRDERGASAVEWAIISAGVAALALAVFAIVRSKVIGKANSIPTD